ncbi:MAG: TetR/AcrR family transcriptional regulator [Deltaproteobacteria bacterium]|jgi:AcrR family transcriptional regulator|nr:TetR/AcrR family transcriptional regulator [Deltaproteobacteria bacterium]
MRNKDELKQQAIIDATINLVNEIGFVACSVSKIAKKADVSPATLYVYYKNKEDLLVSTYIEIKQLFGRKLLNNFDDTLPIRDILKNLWFNIFMFTQKSPEYFQFTEQFSNSPFSELVDQEKVERNFEPIYQIILKGIDQKIIKNVSFDIISAFIFFPAMTLSNKKFCKSFEPTPDHIETAFNLAWDAIKY